MLNYEWITRQLPGGLAELILELIGKVRADPEAFKGLTRDDIVRWLGEPKQEAKRR